MRRRLAPLLSAVVALGLFGIEPSPPAAADTNVCTGEAVVNISPGLTYPVTVTRPTFTNADVRVREPSTVGFALSFMIGTCAPDLFKSVIATGSLTGWCGHSSGQGVTGNGHQFAWVSAGGVMLITGEVTGVGHVMADPTLLPWNDCNSTFGATRFLVHFAVALRHCAIPQVAGLVIFPMPPTSTVTTTGPVTWGVHTGPLHEHWAFCV